jgi:hypothetical protein
MKIYVNGEIKGTNSFTGGVPGYTNYFFLGAHTWDLYANAKLDDVRIYNRALSEDEIRQLAAIPLPSTLVLLGGGLFCLAGLGRKLATKK